MAAATIGKPRSVLLAGRLLDGRYQVGPTMGWGGLTDVYYARDRVTGDAVAVKVLSGVEPAAIGPAVADAEALAMLHDPAIARLRDRGVRDGTQYLVLDLVEGPSLAELVQRGPIDEDDVAAFGAVLARALAHAHAVGVVHRDLKPGNVLFTAVGEPKLIDFGIALLADPAAVLGGHTVAGLQAYLAPEQVRGEPAGPPSDVYSLGLVLLEALTAARAFIGAPADAAVTRLREQPVVPESVSPWLAGVLAAMLAIDPQDRPTAATVAAALGNRTALGDLPPQAEPEVAEIDLSDGHDAGVSLGPPALAVPPPSPAERWAGTAAPVVALVVVALLVMLALVVLS